MRNNTIAFAVSCLVLAACLLAGCSSEAPGTSERLDALESEVKALKDEAGAREKALREELAQIRVNLDGIQSMLEVEKGRAEAPEKSEVTPDGEEGDLDSQIDTKAKTFVKENLDRLLAITKKLLDKMEQELDKATEEEAPAPEGDQI